MTAPTVHGALEIEGTYQRHVLYFKSKLTPQGKFSSDQETFGLMNQELTFVPHESRGGEQVLNKKFLSQKKVISSKDRNM